jgi:hypothetical protein
MWRCLRRAASGTTRVGETVSIFPYVVVPLTTHDTSKFRRHHATDATIIIIDIMKHCVFGDGDSYNIHYTYIIRTMWTRLLQVQVQYSITVHLNRSSCTSTSRSTQYWGVREILLFGDTSQVAQTN